MGVGGLGLCGGYRGLYGGYIELYGVQAFSFRGPAGCGNTSFRLCRV